MGFSVRVLSETFLKSPQGFWNDLFRLFCQQWHFALAEESQEQLTHAERDGSSISLSGICISLKRRTSVPGRQAAGFCGSPALSSFCCFR